MSQHSLLLAVTVLATAHLVGARGVDPTALFPVDFGADPTGRADSTAAFHAVIAALLARNTSGRVLSGKAADLGGATIDLQGGDYLISAPLATPNYYGNYRIVDGTLRASASFPPSSFLLELGGSDGVCPEASEPMYAACAANVAVSNLLLDGGGVAAGGLHAAYHMGLNAGPDLYVVNFTVAGVLVTGGHEVLLHQSWVGQRRWESPDPPWSRGGTRGERHAPTSRVRAVGASAAAADAPLGPVPRRADVVAAFTREGIAATAVRAAALAAAAREQGHPWFTPDGVPAPGAPAFHVTGSAGVVVNSNDHYLTDVVVFSGTTYGVVVTGAANLLTGVHTWNKANTNGGYGIVDTGGPAGGLNRYVGCYADYNDHVMYNPQLVTLQGGFYLCGGRIVLAATGANAPAVGVTISGNQFAGTCGRASASTVVTDTSNGTFAAPVDVTVRDAAVQGPWVVTGTKLTRSLTARFTTRWVIDFTPWLLFNPSTAPIRVVSYAFVLDAGQYARSAARAPTGGTVAIETDASVSGTLTVTVDQSGRT